MSEQHGYDFHLVAVITNGDGNVRIQRAGKKFPLREGEQQRAMADAFNSAVQTLDEFIRPNKGNVS